MARVRLMYGDCTLRMREIANASIDAVICDPPYAEISRDYGRLTEAKWHDLMRLVVSECRRILKPQGSAVFILQPNSEKIGRMRAWLFEFEVYILKHWNLIQDMYWFNPATPPNGLTTKGKLCRGSVKHCVWAGSPDCYRNQDRAVVPVSASMKAGQTRVHRNIRVTFPSGHSFNLAKAFRRSIIRGGCTPFNMLSFMNSTSHGRGMAQGEAIKGGHAATTPDALCAWWARYIVPDGGSVCDPFMGSGTMGRVCAAKGLDFIGIEKERKYYEYACASLGVPYESNGRVKA